jgi:hypothetical protein
MRTIALFLGCWLSWFPLLAQDRLSIEEAYTRRMIDIAMKGHGGYRGEKLHVWFKNLSGDSLSLLVPPGLQVASRDSNQQDLIITAPAYLTLDPREVKALDLYTMCTQSYNMSPRRGEVFTLAGLAEEPLLSLVQKIAAGNYQNSTAQSAVWATANRRGHRDVFGEDPAMVRDLAESVSRANDVPLSEFDLRPRRHQITSIGTSFEILTDQYLRDASLKIYRPDGELHQTYFADKTVARGYHQWKLGVNHTLGDSAELRLVLAEGEAVIAERIVRLGDTVLPLHRYHSEVMLGYELPAATRADLGVYDEAGDLYFLLREGQPVQPGFHRSRVIVGVDLPRDRAYFVQVRANGQVLGSQALDPEAAAPQRHAKRRVSGSARLEVAEPVIDGRLALYDAAGQLKRVYYEIPRLNPGPRRFAYEFEHVAGPGAVFYLRLTDSEGRVLAQEVIRDE